MSAIQSFPSIILNDKPYTVDAMMKLFRKPNGAIRKQKTQPYHWRKLRDFSGYAKDIPDMALWLLRFLADVHLGNRWIPLKLGQKMGIFVPNPGQLLLYNSMIEQGFALEPIRPIIPKSRRQGVSSGLDILIDFLCDHIEDRKAMIVAHQDDSAKALFETVLQSHAKMLEMRERKPKNWQSLAKTKIEYERTGSTFRVGTAMGRFKGSGGTLSYLHISELAKYDTTSGQDEKAMRSLLNSVTKNDVNTIIAIESSGQGPGGEFHRRCSAAFSSEHDDQTESKFKGVFLPWMLDKMCHSASKKCPKTFEEFNPKPEGYEKYLIDAKGVTPSQLQWRREELKEEGVSDFSENPPEWAWEWPVDWEDCFKSQTGLVYPQMVQKHPKCQIIPDSFFSHESYHSHAIDWGQSASSPFVCLWVRVDPTKNPALVIHPDCVNTWREFLTYKYCEKTGAPKKENDHACFGGETEFLVRNKGWTPIQELVGCEGEVWTPAGWRPFWNVHKKSENRSTIETAFEDGFSIVTTPDHKIWDGEDFVAVSRAPVIVPVIRSDKYETSSRSDSAGRWDSNFSGRVLLKESHGRIPVQQGQASSPGSLGIPQWGDSEGLCCSPYRREQAEQLLGQSINDDPWRSRQSSYERGCKEESTSEDVERKGYSGAKEVEKNEGRKRSFQEAGQAYVGRGEGERKGPNACMWDMRQGVQVEVAAKEGHVLQQQPVRGDWTPCARWVEAVPEAYKMHGMWRGVSRTEEIKVLRQKLCNGILKVHLKGLAVSSQKPAGIQEVYDLTIDGANCATLRNGIIMSQCDAIRYYVATEKPRGLVYLYRELFIKEFGERSGVGEILRRIHEAQGWRHANGDPKSMDFHGYGPGPGAVADFRTGVMDRAAGQAIINQFCTWKVPVRGYTAMSEQDKGKSQISAGIAMVGALCSGNLILDPIEVDPMQELARSAARKLRSSREWPTDEEYAAYEKMRELHLGETEPDRRRSLHSTGWREICG